MSHRETAITFLKLAASRKVREAYNNYVSPNFRHHNPFFRGDRESLMLAMKNATKNPTKKLQIKRTLEDGDLVVTYSYVQQNPDDAAAAVVHIFRFEGDRIAELWDIGQAVPEVSPNENGMF